MIYGRLSILILSVLLDVTASGQSTPQELLATAKQLSDSYNWSDAEPSFAASEQAFLMAGDLRDALYARFGGVRSRMEQLNLPQASAELASELSNPLVVSDPELKMFALRVKGDIDNELNSPVMAKDDWQQVLQLAGNLGDTRWQYRSKGELSISAFMQGEVAEARKLVTEALLAADANKDVAATLRFLTHIGTGLVLLKSYNDGLPYLDRALTIAAEHPETGYPFLTKQGKVQGLSGLQRYDEAEQLGTEILNVARSKQRHVKEAQVLITLAKIARHRHRDVQATNLLEQSIQLSSAGGFQRLLAEAQFELADIALLRGDGETAERLAERAAIDTRVAGELYVVPERLRFVAQLKVSRGKFTEADELYTEAADIVDIMLVNCPTANLKATLIRAMSRIYAEHFSLLAEQGGSAASAYRVLERARGRSTNDLLQTGFSAEQASTKEIDRQLSTLHVRLSGATTKREVSAIRDEIFLMQQRRWLTVRAQTPEPPPLATLDEVRRHLARDELLLEFVWSDPKSYFVMISRQSARIISVAGQRDLKPLVDGFLNAVQRKQAAEAEGRKLYEALFAHVPDFDSKLRLIIVPDGPLHLIPFDALVNSKGQRLVQSHVVTVSSSGSTEVYLRKAARSVTAGPPTMLGVGGVPYDRSNTKMALTRGYSEDELGNIPSSRDEVVAAAGALGKGQQWLLLGSAATEHAFKSRLASKPQVVHLAVHGIADREYPDRAGLLLLSDAANGEDGVLYPHEIVQLGLSAELVVLSACDTAVGKLQGQEGIANLSRAFLLAGANTVVSTLWSIDDVFSLYLMKRFYERLSSGSPRADALVEAKRDMIRKFGRTAVPYYWAGFVIEGIGYRPLVSRSGRNDAQSRTAAARIE